MTSTRVRQKPKRFSDEIFTPGANNGYTAGREIDMGHPSMLPTDGEQSFSSADDFTPLSGTASATEEGDDLDSEGAVEAGWDSESGEDLSQKPTSYLTVPIDVVPLVMGHRNRTVRMVCRDVGNGCNIRYEGRGRFRIEADTVAAIDGAVQYFRIERLFTGVELNRATASVTGIDLGQSGHPSQDWGFRSHTTMPPPRKRRCVRLNYDRNKLLEGALLTPR